jgi:hypothetical protein
MNKIGTRVVRVDLTQEEFNDGRRLLFNTEKCIGATALKKAFPNYDKVSFGAISGQVYSKKFLYTYETLDTDGKELVVMCLEKPQTIVFVLTEKIKRMF